ncbi:hypothetical protein, partial [Klebsiella pneumoniae]
GGKAAQHREGFDADGLWIVDPNGMLIQIVDRPDEPDLEAGEPFAINAPGAIVRQDRSAMKPRAATPATKPLRLGHVLVFTPDVATSIRF